MSHEDARFKFVLYVLFDRIIKGATQGREEILRKEVVGEEDNTHGSKAEKGHLEGKGGRVRGWVTSIVV